MDPGSFGVGRMANPSVAVAVPPPESQSREWSQARAQAKSRVLKDLGIEFKLKSVNEKILVEPNMSSTSV